MVIEKKSVRDKNPDEKIKNKKLVYWMLLLIVSLGSVGAGAYYIHLEFFKIIDDHQIKIDKNKNLLNKLEDALENHKKIVSKEVSKIKEDINALKLKD